MMIKKEAGICPVCGGYDTHEEFAWMEDSTVAVDCTCNSCDDTWREYYALVYDGYRRGDDCYDELGEEM